MRIRSPEERDTAMAQLSDIEIAQGAKMLPITEISDKLGIDPELVEHYVIADEKYVGIKMHNERVKKAGEEVYLRSFGFNSDLQ